ncbi:MAG: TRAP transporter substrate-binding protein DctP [Desulfocapsaceae bacterium]|nr:TRAP transporter substrate-binding protein DctP [Desulfocapsaceae bacterium]
MKKIFHILLMCWVLFGVHFQNAQAEDVRPWKIGHVRPAGSVIDQDIRKFMNTVSRETAGKISFEMYAANKLGDYSVVQERVTLGEVEMYLGPFGTAVDRRLSLSFTPFLVENWQEARRVYGDSSPLRKQMESYLKDQNIKIIGGYPVYFGGLALTEKPLSPVDPDVDKNTIIRVPPMRSFDLTARELGYTPYAITWMYARMGLKTGMVGGIIGGGAEGYKGLPSIRFYLPLKDHFEYWYLYMNLDLWNALAEEEQKIISSAADLMERQRYLVAEEQERQSITELAQAGIEVIEIPSEMQERMREKVKQNVWPVLQKDIGPPFTEVVRYATEK